MKRIVYTVLIFTAFSLSSLQLFAQSSFSASDTDQFYPDFRADGDMQLLGSYRNPSKSSISYGAWIMPIFLDQRDDSTSLTTAIVSTKIWMRAYLWENAFLYLRAKDVFQGRISQSGGYDVKAGDNTIDLDIASLNVRNESGNLNFYIGRKFYNLGTGIVFNGRGDGLEVDFYSKYINVKAFALYTGLLAKDSNPYNLSDKDIANGARRFFIGSSVSTEFFNQEFYVLGLAQVDIGKEDSDSKSRYQSYYVGGGIKGVPYNMLSYYAEYIFEFGKSYTVTSVLNADGSTTLVSEKKDIRAMAAVVGISYYFDVLLFPSLSVQYAYGSGDGDRFDHRLPVSNQLGNDNGFLYFGTFVGGYALRPLLANIHVIRGGVTFAPFSWVDPGFIKRMSLTAKYSYYMKDRTEGTINFGEAIIDSRQVGHGVDLAYRWKIFFDFSFFVNYALFIKGNAYGDGENDLIHFTMAGFNISF